jgi:CPA2 family monovalent cation:H+ antiporter-2
MAVASTVVLVRVLTDNRLLNTAHGHVAVGWLVVEDILTVIVLVLIPAMGTPTPAGEGEVVAEVAAAATTLGKSLLFAVLKLCALVAIVLFAGSRVIPWIMIRIARLRSRELFTLTVLMLAIAIAAGSSYVFGASMALGAFLAGMVVGQSPVSQQAAADALPLRDAFAVLFFTSVGMLFDPKFVIEHPGLLAAGLGIVLIGKPLAALIIVAVIGYPVRTALIVALGLAQIGEFSFILAELGKRHHLIDETERNLLIAVALVTISLNPLLFRLEGPLEARLRARPKLWRLLNYKSARREERFNAIACERIQKSEKQLAVILGYGPVGRSVDELLRDSELETVIVDLNMDTIGALTNEGRTAIYGDASNIEVLAEALPNAKYVVITLPHSANRGPLIAAVKLINPQIKIFVRARYVGERDELIQTGADAAVFEEAEVAVALARIVLAERGADDRAIGHETSRIRRRLHAESPQLR